MADRAGWRPQRWAIEISKLWRAASGAKRFPVEVETIAKDLSAKWYASDPIKAIEGGRLPKFEGALYPLDDCPSGWAIIYNESGVSPGRRRFTVSHEFGHYLLHRANLPQGIECDETVVIRREGKGIEKEADEFAAGLLMPLDDFRARIGRGDKPSLDDVGASADRYGSTPMADIKGRSSRMRWEPFSSA